MCLHRYRGFESHPLRHPLHHEGGGKARNPAAGSTAAEWVVARPRAAARHTDSTTVRGDGSGPTRWRRSEPGQAGNGAALRSSRQARGARALRRARLFFAGGPGARDAEAPEPPSRRAPERPDLGSSLPKSRSLAGASSGRGRPSEERRPRVATPGDPPHGRLPCRWRPSAGPSFLSEPGRLWVVRPGIPWPGAQPQRPDPAAGPSGQARRPDPASWARSPRALASGAGLRLRASVPHRR